MKKRKDKIEYNKRGLELGAKVKAGKFHNGDRLKKYTIEEVRKKIEEGFNDEEHGDTRKDYFLEPELLADRKIKTRRAKVYFRKGFGCIKENCDIEGLYFTLDLDFGGGIHLDLYGTEKDGTEVLMTIDHIHPKAKGGKNRLDNYQPMCLVCNHIKADKV